MLVESVAFICNFTFICLFFIVRPLQCHVYSVVGTLFNVNSCYGTVFSISDGKD